MHGPWIGLVVELLHSAFVQYPCVDAALFLSCCCLLALSLSLSLSLFRCCVVRCLLAALFWKNSFASFFALHHHVNSLVISSVFCNSPSALSELSDTPGGWNVGQKTRPVVRCINHTQPKEPRQNWEMSRLQKAWDMRAENPMRSPKAFWSVVCPVLGRTVLLQAHCCSHIDSTESCKRGNNTSEFWVPLAIIFTNCNALGLFFLEYQHVPVWMLQKFDWCSSPASLTYRYDMYYNHINKSKICVDLDKLFKYGIQHQQFTEVDFVSSGWVSPVFAPRRPSGADLAAMAAAGTLPPVNPVSWHMKPDWVESSRWVDRSLEIWNFKV